LFDTIESLITQIRIGEDSTLEVKSLGFKGSQIISPARDSFADEMAAMANSASGVIVLGVDDKTKKIIGIPQELLDAAETWVRSICNDSIKPQLICEIRKLSIVSEAGERLFIIRIDIPRSLFVHQSPTGYFYRIGSSKRQMSTEMLGRLIQQRSQARTVYFDEQAVTHADVSCLEKELWSKFTTDLSPADDTEFLYKMRLIADDDTGVPRPTVSGLLLACQKPNEYIRNAYIQAVAYKGTERDAVYQIDAIDIEGPLDVQIKKACDFVHKNMRVFALNSPDRRIPQYSIRAVFEAVVNAVAHRDYSIYASKIRLHLFSDRLELFSPGCIPNTMSVESLPLRQATRNELITSLLARCATPAGINGVLREYIMDKRGEGVPIILSESKKLSGSAPKYILIDNTELMLTIYAYMHNESA